MTSNEIDKDAKAPGKPQDDSAAKAAKSEDKRELTDDEVAAVAGGSTAKLPTKDYHIPGNTF